jgi:hypothetical protein
MRYDLLTMLPEKAFQPVGKKKVTFSIIQNVLINKMAVILYKSHKEE